jgi:mono/diheme cytochrome c family protein
MRPAVLAGLAVAIAAAAAFALSPLVAEEEAGLLPYTDAEVVAEGRAIYADHCAACHGANLEGQPDWRQADAEGYLPAPPHDETGHTWHHPDALLIEITTRGTEAVVGDGYRSNMGGFGGILSDDEILAVLAYIKSTWPPRVIALHDRLNADAEALSR